MNTQNGQGSSTGYTTGYRSQNGYTNGSYPTYQNSWNAGPGTNRTRHPQLLFTPTAWEQLQVFLALSELEISGFGRTTEVSPGVYLVDEIFLLEQEVSHAHTELDMSAVALLVADLVEQDKEPNLKLWWHSHHKMEAFWSDQDERAIHNLIENGGFVFSLVGRQNGEVRIRFDMHDPALTIDQLPHRVIWRQSEFAQACQEEMELKVRRAPQGQVYQQEEEEPTGKRGKRNNRKGGNNNGHVINGNGANNGPVGGAPNLGDAITHALNNVT